MVVVPGAPDLNVCNCPCFVAGEVVGKHLRFPDLLDCSIDVKTIYVLEVRLLTPFSYRLCPLIDSRLRESVFIMGPVTNTGVRLFPFYVVGVGVKLEGNIEAFPNSGSLMGQ
jgi:hypothetical protein